MDKESIISTIRETLEMVKPSVGRSVSADDHLMDDCGLESLDMVELVARLEERFQTPISDDDYRKLLTIDKIAEYILEHQSVALGRA